MLFCQCVVRKATAHVGTKGVKHASPSAEGFSRYLRWNSVASKRVSHLHIFFCPCVVLQATAYVGKKALNMRHQAQKVFHGIFVGIPQHKKGYLVYVPCTRKIISPYDVIFY